MDANPHINLYGSVRRPVYESYDPRLDVRLRMPVDRRPLLVLGPGGAFDRWIQAGDLESAEDARSGSAIGLAAAGLAGGVMGLLAGLLV